MTSSELRIDAVDPGSSVARWCLDQYYDELRGRFAEGFDPTKSAAADASVFTPPSGVFLIARVRGRAVACGAVKLTAEHVGYIKRMWVDPSCRGVGLGRRLLGALEDAAADLGCDVVQLETHRSLKGAMKLYLSSGYQEIEPFNDEFYAHHWFEKRLGNEMAKKI